MRHDYFFLRTRLVVNWVWLALTAFPIRFNASWFVESSVTGLKSALKGLQFIVASVPSLSQYFITQAETETRAGLSED